MADDWESDRAGRRSGFLGFVAHEIRNPLSTALWTAELLSRLSAEERGGARGDKLAAMCLRSVSRVRQLVEDHLLCERLDAGGVSLRLEPLAPREVVEALLQRPGHEHGSVALEIDAGLAVEADRTLLERALDGLIAVAGREGAAVRVAARAEGDSVAVSVHGRPPGEGDIEDPVKGSPSDPKGRALALPLARRIASALGGALTAADGAYVLSLPRAKSYAARPKPAAHP